MRSMTIKLPEAVARRLKEEARETGRSVAAIIRDRLEVMPPEAGSVYALSGDLARRQPIGNEHPAEVSPNVISICDTGPLVAYLNRGGPHHRWAVPADRERACADAATTASRLIHSFNCSSDPRY